MRGEFDDIRPFPEIKEASTKLWFYSARTASVGLSVWGKMPFANQVCRIAGFAQLSGKRGKSLAESNAVAPNTGFSCIAAGE
jgi:hypothetical protein